MCGAYRRIDPNFNRGETDGLCMRKGCKTEVRVVQGGGGARHSGGAPQLSVGQLLPLT